MNSKMEDYSLAWDILLALIRIACWSFYQFSAHSKDQLFEVSGCKRSNLNWSPAISPRPIFLVFSFEALFRC